MNSATPPGLNSSRPGQILQRARSHPSRLRPRSPSSPPDRANAATVRPRHCADRAAHVRAAPLSTRVEGRYFLPPHFPISARFGAAPGATAVESSAPSAVVVAPACPVFKLLQRHREEPRSHPEPSRHPPLFSSAVPRPTSATEPRRRHLIEHRPSAVPLTGPIAGRHEELLQSPSTASSARSSLCTASSGHHPGPSSLPRASPPPRGARRPPRQLPRPTVHPIAAVPLRPTRATTDSLPPVSSHPPRPQNGFPTSPARSTAPPRAPRRWQAVGIDRRRRPRVMGSSAPLFCVGCQPIGRQAFSWAWPMWPICTKSFHIFH
jgi:hypothetical protein